MKKIQIITGKIRVGKTTFLESYISSLNNVGGIIQPSVEEHRFFQDIQTNELFRITEPQEQQNTFLLGRFIFNSDSFSWAKSKLNKALEKNIGTIVVDEYGPLEFKGEGLEPVVSKIFSGVEKNEVKIIIVIREQLLEKLLKKFKLKHEDVEIIYVENQSKVLR